MSVKFEINRDLDYLGVPVVALAKQEFFVPLLAVRQNRKVVPGLNRLLPIVGDLRLNPRALSEEAFNDMAATIHAALTRAYPAMTLEQFLDLPISVFEMLEAIGVIARQTGLYRPVPLGEQEGEAIPPTST